RSTGLAPSWMRCCGGYRLRNLHAKGAAGRRSGRPLRDYGRGIRKGPFTALEVKKVPLHAPVACSLVGEVGLLLAGRVGGDDGPGSGGDPLGADRRGDGLQVGGGERTGGLDRGRAAGGGGPSRAGGGGRGGRGAR